MSVQSVRRFREQAERFVVVVTKQNSCYKYVAKLFSAVFTKRHLLAMKIRYNGYSTIF